MVNIIEPCSLSYTVTIHQTGGTTLVKEINAPAGSIILEEDVRKYFPDSKAVNEMLRAIIKQFPKQQIQ